MSDHDAFLQEKMEASSSVSVYELYAFFDRWKFLILGLGTLTSLLTLLWFSLKPVHYENQFSFDADSMNMHVLHDTKRVNTAFAGLLAQNAYTTKFSGTFVDTFMESMGVEREADVKVFFGEIVDSILQVGDRKQLLQDFSHREELKSVFAFYLQEIVASDLRLMQEDDVKKHPREKKLGYQISYKEGSWTVHVRTRVSGIGHQLKRATIMALQKAVQTYNEDMVQIQDSARREALEQTKKNFLDLKQQWSTSLAVKEPEQFQLKLEYFRLHQQLLGMRKSPSLQTSNQKIEWIVDLNHMSGYADVLYMEEGLRQMLEEYTVLANSSASGVEKVQAWQVELADFHSRLALYKTRVGSDRSTLASTDAAMLTGLSTHFPIVERKNFALPSTQDAVDMQMIKSLDQKLYEVSDREAVSKVLIGGFAVGLILAFLIALFKHLSEMMKRHRQQFGRSSAKQVEKKIAEKVLS